MKIKIVGIFFLTFLLLGLSINFTYAEEVNFIDPNIPDSWYEAPKTASELNISEFNQSPILDEKVNRGAIPEVEKRLPEDPPVIEPYDKIGRYGGTIVTWATSLAPMWNNDAICFQQNEHSGRAAPDGSKEIPYLLKGWDYSDDYKTLTLYLREGLKWSDGVPFNSDDYIFWWEHVANNEDLSPVPPDEWNPPLMDVEKVDDYTVKYHYGIPVPTRHHEFHIWDWGPIIYPSHYLKDFHPDFIGEEEAKQKAEEYELDYWYELFQAVQSNTTDPSEVGGTRPTMRRYIAVKRAETYLEYERNPYFPFVDTEGNQLPYIDKLKINLANDQEMVTMKGITGEATFALQTLSANELPMIQKNEDEGNYNTYVWTSGRGAEVYIMPNLNHKEDNIRNILQDVKFRRAFSLAIDRENINRKLYFGMAVPRQNTLLPTSKYYEDKFGEAYANYDPERAKELLNDIGMVDVDDDGFRETPDGNEFKTELIYFETSTPQTEILEMLRKQWREVGLNIVPKMTSSSLYTTRKYANNWDFSSFWSDRSNDLIFPRQLNQTFAPVGGDARWGPFIKWSQWENTDGKEGEEPPEEIKELLIEPAQQLKHSSDPEVRFNAGKKLLEAQAENLWTIGTVGMAPVPIIVNNKLKNLPEKGIWADTLQNLGPYYSIQLYLEE